MDICPVQFSGHCSNGLRKKIEVGTVLTKGIGIGAGVKPLPLPEGEWTVVNKRQEDLKITGNTNHAFTSRPLPFVFLTLKSNPTVNGSVFAMVVSFTPYSSDITWTNRNCTTTNANALVDNFDLTPDAVVYVCGIMYSHSGFKTKVANIPAGQNQWWKNNIAALSAYPDEIPDDALWVDLFGSRFKALRVNYAFIMKREGDLINDPVYAKFVKDWTHAAGLSLANVLSDKTASFVVPTGYVAQSKQ
jgi:hypothetical protein